MSRRRRPAVRETAEATGEGADALAPVRKRPSVWHNCPHADCEFGDRSKQETMLHARCVYHTADGDDKMARCAPTVNQQCGIPGVGHSPIDAQAARLECRWAQCDETFG